MVAQVVSGVVAAEDGDGTVELGGDAFVAPCAGTASWFSHGWGGFSDMLEGDWKGGLT